jgi:hypothetical protein
MKMVGRGPSFHDDGGGDGDGDGGGGGDDDDKFEIM